MQWPPLLFSCVMILATSMIEAYSLQRKNIWSANRPTIWFSPFYQPESDLASQLNNNDIQADSEILDRIGKRGFTTISRWQPSRKEEERLRSRSLVSLIPGMNFFAAIQRKTRQGVQEKYRRPIGLPLRWG